jgi:hypothetical protein
MGSSSGAPGMNKRIHCFTSVSFNYLDRASVLAETVRRYHPDWTLWVIVSDELPAGMVEADLSHGFDHLLNVMDLGIPTPLQWIFGHDVIELCTAVKGAMLSRLLRLDDADAVVYLDPDTALFAPLDHVVDMLDRHSVVLTPHVVDPEPRESGILDNEIGSLKHGTYNLGFVAVQASSEGIRFADWWRDRLLKFCIDDVPNGLFTDQKWCDLTPALFDGVGILRDRGYNVAAWNLGNRPITLTPEGSILAGGAPLRFFHFTKVNSVGEQVLAHYAYGKPEVFELLRWYRERLNAHKVQGLPDRWWLYGNFADGTPISRAYRRLWRIRGDARATFTNPFDSSPYSFQRWAISEGLVPSYSDQDR